jgi:hypothetical protein
MLAGQTACRRQKRRVLLLLLLGLLSEPRLPLLLLLLQEQPWLGLWVAVQWCVRKNSKRWVACGSRLAYMCAEKDVCKQLHLGLCR